MAKPKICLLFAGGTIGMVQNTKTGALEPAANSFEIIKNFPEIRKIIDLDFKMVINIDSSNMEPRHWTQIAKEIKQNYDKYDGFVIAQGTDTMAYTASALSFSLQNLSKPVVFTGSVIPLNEIGSDARNNLSYACITATLDIAEVCIIFANNIIRGNRAKKFDETFTVAFHSPNYPYLGELGRPIQLHPWRKKRRKRSLKFQPEFNANIALIKLFPGFNPEIIENVINRKADGIIIEGFGPGNIPFLDKSIVPKIEKSIKNNIPVIIASQMEKGKTNLNAYEAGYYAKKAGAISARDMTIEATVTKLMWILQQTKDIRVIKKQIESNISGELEDQT